MQDYKELHMTKQGYEGPYRTIYCQAQPKPQLKLSWAEFSIILTKSTT